MEVNKGRAVLLAGALMAVASSGYGQGIPRDDYLRYLPLEYPRLTRQTAANAELHLFGDRSSLTYRDADPVDGIDDARGRVLKALSLRFAPFMVQNTFSIPMDVKKLMRRNASFPLHVDTWELAQGGALDQTEEIDMNRLGLASCPGDALTDIPRNEGSEDCRLVELLDEFDPDRPTNPRSRVQPLDVGSDRFKVLYFDQPGYDPKSWKAVYLNPITERLSAEFHGFPKVYAHPFVEEHRDESRGSSGYEILIQYWFYYPLNDGGNKHEGDWEHINVVISPRDRVKDLLSAPEVQRILDGRGLGNEAGRDELVIKRVEYYFHHQVMIFDYAQPNVYASRAEWEAEVASLPREQVGVGRVWERIRWLAYRDDGETVANTHPVAYIGGDNKGIDQLIVSPGGKNQDSHGMFPMPGLYKTVGPAGSAEQIPTAFDHREWYAAPLEERADPARRYGRGSTELFDDASRVEVIPDWERVLPLVKSNPEARREWAWLVLPTRWGYPATPSPLAGIIDNADTGNVGPVGPAFNAGWNRSGEGRGFESYSPHLLPSFFPAEPQDGFSNNLGYFNTIPLLSNLPPFDFIWRVVALPFRAALKRQDPIYYPGTRVPPRFIGVAGGAARVSVPDDLVSAVTHLTDDNAIDVGGDLLPAPLVRIAADIFALDPEGGGEAGETFAESSWGVHGQLTFFIGSRFVSATGFRHSNHRVGLRVPLSTRTQPYEFTADVDWWDLTAEIHYNLTSSAFKPYLKLGYGVNWYRLENMTSDGEPLDDRTGPWIHNFWPPTWQYGLGAELALLQRFGRIPHGLDLSVRADWSWLSSPLGLDFPGSFTLETFRDAPTRWTRRTLNLGLTVSF